MLRCIALIILISLVSLALATPLYAQSWLAGPATTTSHYAGTAILLQNGKVLIMGGRTPAIEGNACELYDPLANSISPAPSMNGSRYWHSSIMLRNGKVLVIGGIDASNQIRSECELYDPVTNTWAPTSSMQNARMRATTTLLSDGRVLIAGGHSGNGLLNACEIYDPVTGAWSPAASMREGRNCHAAALLPNGTVLVASGYGYMATCELYDPVRNVWRQTGSLANSQFPTGEHSLTLLEDGRLLLAGGWGGGKGMASRCEIYDPATETWTATGALATPRCGQRMVLLPDGKVMAIAGHNARTTSDQTCFSINSCEIYDPATGRWSPGPTIPQVITYFVGTMLPSGKIFISGGGYRLDTQSPKTYYRTSYLLDPSTGTVSLAGMMPGGGLMPSAMLLPTGRLMVAGGTVDCGTLGSSQTLLYDPKLNTWSSTAAMLRNRHAHTATLLPQGKVLVVGGISDNRPSAEAELFDYTTNRWTPAAPLASPRSLHTATLLAGGGAIAIGGFSGGDLEHPANITGTTEQYDPLTSRWNAGSAMFSPRYAHTATTLPDGRILVTGGINQTSLASCEIYDPRCDMWTPVAAMRTPRGFHTATLLSDGRVLVGGGLNNGVSTAACEVYDARTDTWTSVGSMAHARGRHTATLMANGDVLVADGIDAEGQSLGNVEAFSLINGQWNTSATLPVARNSHAAVLLPDGSVLIAGGISSEGGACSVPLQPDIYRPLSGFAETNRPTIISMSSDQLLIVGSNDTRIDVLGSGFRDNNRRLGTEGSTGDYNSSVTNFPVVQIRRIGGDRHDNDFTGYLPFDSESSRWSSTETHVRFPMGTPGKRVYPAGYYALTVIANGIPSLPVYFVVSYDDPVTVSGIEVTQTQSQCTIQGYDIANTCGITSIALNDASSENVALVIDRQLPSNSLHITVKLIDGRKPGRFQLMVNGKAVADGYLAAYAITTSERLSINAALDAVCDSVRISNGSDDPVVIPSARMLGATGFSFPPSQFPRTIPAHASTMLQVCYAPGNRTAEYDTLLISDQCGTYPIPLEAKVDLGTTGVTGCNTRINTRPIQADKAVVTSSPPVVIDGSTVRIRVDQYAASEQDFMEIRGAIYTSLGGLVGEAHYRRLTLQFEGNVALERGILEIDARDWPQGIYLFTVRTATGVIGYPVNIVR